MAAVKRRPLEVASRRVVQDAKLAIRDVYDAIVELVTNADDRYQILGPQAGWRSNSAGKAGANPRSCVCATSPTE